MLGDSFTVDGNTYKIQKELKLGEYRNINRINAKVSRLSIGLKDEVTPETAFAEASDEQLQVICDFLESHLGITQEQINDMSPSTAIEIFQEAVKLSTTPDKAIKKT